MATANSEAVCIYGARIISKHLAAMAVEVDGVLAAEDIEYIHRMRVATRRMRSALTLFSDCFSQQELKNFSREVRKVTRALGEARDLDVQLALIDEVLPDFSSSRLSPGIKRLQLRFKQKRAEAQKHVISAMEMIIADRLLERIGLWAAPLVTDTGSVYLYSPVLYTLAFDGIKKHLDELLAHVPFIHDPENITELHAMRISAKRLRYTLEAFQDLYGGNLKPFINQTRKLQDQLGLVHDMDVWIMVIPDFIEEERARIFGYFGHEGPLKRLLPGLEAFKASRIQVREATYAEFLQEWAQIEQTGVWEGLMQTVNIPMDLDAAIKTLLAAQAASEQEAPGSGSDNLDEGE